MPTAYWKSFGAPQAALEPEEPDVLCKARHSRAHGLARSIECADALAMTDRAAVDQDTLRISRTAIERSQPDGNHRRHRP